MEARPRIFTDLLRGNQQFEIPLYQRRYAWSNDERGQFWRDILNASELKGAKHRFLGPIVFTKPDGEMGGATLTRARLIDGQQRITTLTLLMQAIAERLDGQQELLLPITGSSDAQAVSAADIREDYLINRRFSGDSRYKLLPTLADRDTLKHILTGVPLPAQPSAELLKGIEFFRDKLNDPALSIEKVLLGLNRLEVVAVMLVEGHDDPQVIFESLNSTGKDLTQADLIRNNVLMGLGRQEQETLSRDYWMKIEELFADTPEKTFDDFMRNFLTLRTRSLPNEEKVYEAFKAYREGLPAGASVTDLVADIRGVAGHYASILRPSRVAQSGVQAVLRDLADLHVRVTAPFVLELLEDFQQGLLTEPDLVRALRWVESLLVRRTVARYKSSSLNTFFAGLGRELVKDQGSAVYLRSVEQGLMAWQERGIPGFPPDAVFAERLVNSPVYSSRPVCKHVLARIELQRSPKERLETGPLTIEHVMPQNKNLSSAWRDMLGEDWAEVQRVWVDTLGNLTLTGYNSELGDLPFQEKKSLPAPKGYSSSRLFLTQEIAQKAVWTQAEIQERGQELAGDAVKLWQQPQFTVEELAELRDAPKRGGGTYTADWHIAGASLELRALFDEVRQGLLALGDVREEVKKVYVAFKRRTNFCDVMVYRGLNALKVTLNIPFAVLDDPDGLGVDITNQFHHGNGDVEVTLRPGQSEQLEAFMDLARQAYGHQGGVQSAGQAAASRGQRQPIKDLYEKVLALTAGTIPAEGIERQNKQTFLRLDGHKQHIARVNPNYSVGVVELLLNIPFEDVNDPTGRGVPRTEHTSLPRGHFAVGLVPGEEAAAQELLGQLFQHYGVADQ